MRTRGEADAATARSESVPLALRWTIVVATAAAALVYAASIPTRVLINDDYQNLYTAWLQSLGQQPGRDFGAYSPQIVADLLVPVFRWFPQTMVPLYAGRLLVLVWLGASAWLLSRWSRRHMGAIAAWAVVPIALLSAAVLYRGLDLRPDPLLLLLWLWSLWLLGQPLAGRPWRLVALGAALMIMAAVRVKSALMGPVVVAMLVWDLWALDATVRDRLRAALRAGGWMILGAAAGALCFAVLLGSAVRVEVFVENTLKLFDVANDALHHPSGAELKRVLGQSVRQDAALWVLALSGLAVRAAHARRYPARENLLTLWVAAMAVGWVALNPAFYAYNLLVLSFLAAPFAAMAVQQAVSWAQRRASASVAVGVGVALVAAYTAWAAPVMWVHATTRTNAHQMGFHAFLLQATGPDDAVYAMEGVGLFRPSTFHFRMPAVVRGKYHAGLFSAGDELRARPPLIVVQSYRVPMWLEPGPDRDTIDRGYAPLAPRLLVPGRRVEAGAAPEQFDVVLAGGYEVVLQRPLAGRGDDAGVATEAGAPRFVRERGEKTAPAPRPPWRVPPDARCLVDGRPHGDGDRLTLERGPHIIAPPADARCMVRRWFSPEHRRLVRNPDNLPYLISPSLTL